ncbi:putative WD repeat-containing protein [Trichoplax sp. H2]|nr:putative WD repeat-containing protein [Trichoplax sp. H2]|eukprot:RDD37816.1 putative WD repeat-containing protein [Trichoplax sp. H2]
MSEDYIQNEPVATAEGCLKILQTVSNKESFLILSCHGSEGMQPDTRHRQTNPTAEVMCCRFSDDGTLFAAGLSNGQIKVYKADFSTCLYSLSDKDTESLPLPCTTVQFRPNSNSRAGYHLLATYASGFVKVWHVTSSQCLSSVKEPRQVLCASYTYDGSLYATAGSDMEIYVYDCSTKQKAHTCEASYSKISMDGHVYRIFSLQFKNNDRSTFLSGGWDNTIQFWDLREKHSVRYIYGPHLCGDSLRIDSSNKKILTGSWRKDKALQIWDYNTGGLLLDVEPDNYPCQLYCANWLGNDCILAAGNNRNMARVIHRTSMQTTGRVLNMPGGIYTSDIDPNGTIALSSKRNIYRVEKSK